MTDAELIALRLECFDRMTKLDLISEAEDGKQRGLTVEEMLIEADDILAWALCGLEPSEIRTMIDGDL